MNTSEQENKNESIRKLLEYIVQENLSMEKVASRLGCSTATVFNWLHKKSQPNTINLRKINNLINP